MLTSAGQSAAEADNRQNIHEGPLKYVPYDTCDLGHAKSLPLGDHDYIYNVYVYIYIVYIYVSTDKSDHEGTFNTYIHIFTNKLHYKGDNQINRNSITISPNLCLIYFHFMSFLLIFRRSPNGKSLKISITNFHYLTAKLWKRGDASKSLFNYVHS